MSPAEVTHEEIEELVAVEALGGLGRQERNRMVELMSEHGPLCPECHRLSTDYSEVAGNLALAVDPFPISTEEEERLLALARQVEPDAADAGVAILPGEPSTDTPPPGGGASRRGVGPIRRLAAAVAAAATLAALGGVAGYFIASRPSPALRVVAFKAPQGQSLAVVFHPGTRAALVIGSNLPTPPDGRVYELWFRPSGSTRMRPAGTFRPREGSVNAHVTLSSSFDLLAVTVERGFQRAPTGQPLYVAST
jgi:hypothetical protein